MVYIFDIDGTICTNSYGDYDTAEPLQSRIEKNNRLYDDGNKIFYQTARGMGRTHNNVEESHKLFYDYTKKQLEGWGVKYDALFLGKPNGDIYVDDKGANDFTFYDDKDESEDE